MLQERPVFALCTSRIHDPEILESVKAFIAEAHKRGYAVLVFNAGLSQSPASGRDRSCYSVYDLIPFRIVDMIVIMNETIGDNVVAETISAIAKEHRIPIMAYDGKMENVPSVFSYSDLSFSRVLDHIFGEHGCKRVNLLTGTRGHYASESMVMAYIEMLRKHGLPLEEDRIGYGLFAEQPTADAVARFLSKDTPEAIVCANDIIAMTVCAVLNSHGLRVPEDVIVTGLDGSVKERFHSPRLTACQKDYERLSAVALDTAELILDGEDVSLNIEIEPMLRISESCGCHVTEHRDQNFAIRDLTHRLDIMINQEEEEHWLLGEMLERKQPTVIDYLDVLVPNMPDQSYLCLRDSLSPDLDENVLHSFGESGELMSAVTHKGKEKQFSILARNGLIPELDNILVTGKAVFFCSIYMFDEIYGYYSYFGDELDEESFKLPKYIHTAGNVIGSSLATSRLQALNQKLMVARVRDSLTGLLNLHGALKVLHERVAAEPKGGELMMIVIGLNRLSQINSIFGRAEGDQALLSLASAITDSIDSAAVSARIGGDEFLIAFLGKGSHNNTAEALISVLRKRMESYNQVSGKSYTMEISVGRVAAPVNSALSIEQLLNEAITLKDAQHINEDPDAKPAIPDDEAAQMERVISENLLTYHFQPIISVKTGQIYAYEALMRTAGGIHISPLTLLNYATYAGRLYEIEWLTYNNILKYIAANREQFTDKRIFINSIPGHFLKETDFLKIRAKYGDILSQLVVEFTEQAETEGEELRTMQMRCRDNKMDIAVDDYGTGYSNISNLLRYSPNYVKIDRSLISSIHEEPKKQHFVTNIIEFAHANGFMALAEGVETIEELRAVVRFGADLIQGNFTSLPSPIPLETIPGRISSMILKFAANATKQIIQKTYMLSGEESVSLPQLDAEHYTDLFVSQPRLEIIGDFHESSAVHIKIQDNTDCHLILRNVHFRLPVQNASPAIMLGKNSHVTLEFQGDNRMDNGGILVPESSTLHLTGKGNLSIRADDTKAFAIGNDPDLACGDLNIDLAGCLTILSNASQCIGIGSGSSKGQSISITGTKLFFEMTGKNGVCVGTLEGNPKIRLSGCEAVFSLCMANSIALGSAEGKPEILCNTVSLTVHGSGSMICCVGSEQGGADIVLRDSMICAELTGQCILIAGSSNGTPKIALHQCKAEVRIEGTTAMDFGSCEGDAELLLVDSHFDIAIQSAKAMHFAAAPNHLVQTGGSSKVAINQ
ncbi:MAG: EAL domain-containing protein [Oscillospiraceae bacterium]|nr:EAL domain-containing protein [Oscillospiraceae bacterium]